MAATRRAALPQVRLLLPDAGNGRNFGLARTIGEALHARYQWELDLTVHHTLEEFQQEWDRRPADALIAFPTRPFRGGALHHLGVPTLTLLIEDPPLPAILPDDEAIGRLAGQHLQRPGWVPRAVAPFPSPWWNARLRGWREVNPEGTDDLLPKEPRQREAWVKALPANTALFAANDSTALAVATAARRVGRTIGGDLRVLGVDNEIDCLLTTPALSSIALPLRTIGLQAVRQLALQFQNKAIPPRTVVPPGALVVRRSSDPFVDAPDWLRTMEEHLRMTIASGRPPDLLRLLAAQGVHRTTVSRAWRTVTGMSVRDYVHHLRHEIAQSRLAEGRSEVSVAASLGLGSVQALRRILGRTGPQGASRQ